MSGCIDLQVNPAYSAHAQSGGRSGTVSSKRRVVVSGTRSSTNHHHQQQQHHHKNESPSFCMTNSGSNQGDEDVPLRMKKSASSPMLSVPSTDSAGSSSRIVTPGFLSEPPPYTSLPPPLVSFSVHDTEVPPQRIALQSNAYQCDNEEVGERDGEGEGMIYASRSTRAQNGVMVSKYTDETNPLSASLPHFSNASVRQNPRGSHTRGLVHPHLSSSSATKAGSGASLRHRVFAAISSGRIEGGEGDSESDWETNGKNICTTPGVMCAGETETETDEPVRAFFHSYGTLFDHNFIKPRHLPTARVSRSSRLSNSFLASRSTPFMTLPWQMLLFEFSRLLAIVPASIGFMWCIWHLYTHVPCLTPYTARSVPDRIDYLVASLWVSFTDLKVDVIC